MLESLACDIPRVLIGNVMNGGGYVAGLPHDFAVEAPTLVSARGIQPVQTTPLPAPILAHALSDYVAPVNLELEAYERRDRKLLLALILTDPFTRSEGQARGCIPDYWPLLRLRPAKAAGLRSGCGPAKV